MRDIDRFYNGFVVLFFFFPLAHMDVHNNIYILQLL